MIQRVGRINRVDTSFDKIYTYNFFPSEQGNDLLKLKEAAIAKINYFIEMLGNDAKLLTEGEEVKSFELFNKLTSKEFISGEDESDDSELKYLNVIKNIKDNDEKLFVRIKTLPKKARSARMIEDNIKMKKDSVLTYFRKGKLEKFFISSHDVANEIDFITAAKLFEALPETTRANISSTYHELLQKNKQFLKETLQNEIVDDTIPGGHRGRDNAVRILKVLKSREVRNWSSFTEIDESYISSVINLLQEDKLPKATTKRLWSEIKNLQSPPKILGTLKRNLPNEFFNDNTISHSNLLEHPSEVILSECFIK